MTSPSTTLATTGRAEMVDRTIRALGTEVRLVVAARGAGQLAERAAAEVLAYDARLSRFRAGSELCALNADRRVRVPASGLLREAVRAGLWAAARSDGLVDPCLLDALEASGYVASLPATGGRAAAGMPWTAGAARPARPEPAARWRTVRVDDGGGAIERPAGLRLDLGGSGKGHVADRIARLLTGTDRWAIDCGGDVRVGGAGAVHEVLVAHPLRATPVARLHIAAGAVATSSILARAWTDRHGRRAHHLLDPATGRPAWTGLLAATALGRTTLEAETLAKVALLSGAAGARRALARSGGLVVHAGGRVERIGPLPAAADPHAA